MDEPKPAPAKIFVYDPFSQCAPGPGSVGRFLSLCRKGAKIIRCEDGKVVEKRTIHDDEKPVVFAAPLELVSRQRFCSDWTAIEECYVCRAKNLPASFELVSRWKGTDFFACVSEVCAPCYHRIVSDGAFANIEEIARKLG